MEISMRMWTYRGKFITMFLNWCALCQKGIETKTIFLPIAQHLLLLPRDNHIQPSFNFFVNIV